MPRTNGTNRFETELSSSVGATDTSFPVNSTSGLSSPCYVILAPNVPERYEVILMDGTFDASTLATSDLSNRYLEGSAESSSSPGIDHPEGEVVRYSPVQQHFDDLWDDVEDKSSDPHGDSAHSNDYAAASHGSGAHDSTVSDNPHGSGDHDSSVSDNPHGSGDHDSTVSDNPHGSGDHDSTVSDNPHGVDNHDEVFAAENNDLSDITTHSASETGASTTVTVFNVTSGPGVVLGGMVVGNSISSVTLTVDGTSNTLTKVTAEDGGSDDHDIVHVPPVYFDSSAKLEFTTGGQTGRTRSGVAHTRTF